MSKLNYLALAVSMAVGLLLCIFGVLATPWLLLGGAAWIILYLLIVPLRQVNRNRLSRLRADNADKLVIQVAIPRISEWKAVAEALDAPYRDVSAPDRIFGLVVGRGVLQLYRGGTDPRLVLQLPTANVKSMGMLIESSDPYAAKPILSILWGVGAVQLSTALDEWTGGVGAHGRT